jgi:Nucleotidyl transferase AbiEii toxin, Type IV TA system
VTPKPVERLEKTLARVAHEQGLDQERLRRWVSFLALCGVLECAVEKGVIDIYYLKGGVAMELRFARAARTTKDFDLGLRGNRAERIRRLSEVLQLGFDGFTFPLETRTTRDGTGRHRPRRSCRGIQNTGMADH